MSQTIQTKVANLIERRAKTGLVFQDGLLNAVAGLLEYAEGLERRIDAMEKIQTATAVGETAKRVFTGLYEAGIAEAGEGPVAPPEGD